MLLPATCVCLLAVSVIKEAFSADILGPDSAVRHGFWMTSAASNAFYDNFSTRNQFTLFNTLKGMYLKNAAVLFKRP
jgi:hypothetical protein